MAQKNLSKLQENFTCLAIVCVDLIKLPLIDILDNHINPMDLYSEINCSALISGNKLGPDQMKICYITPPGIPDYSKFDVSLLYILIRNLCPSLKPTGKWGVEPAASHTQLGDDIERLRLFRNEFAHANSAEISDGEFNKHWTDLQNVVNRIQSNKKAGCKTDYRQNFKSIKKRLLNFEDLEKYKLFLEATMHVSKQREDMDGPDIWIEGTEEAVCGSTAHFQATVKEKKVSFLSVSWQKLSKNESTQIDKSNKKFWGKTNKELSIESLCKEDEGEYQAILSIEEDRTRITIQSNVIFLHVVGGIPTVTTSYETCLQTHSVNLIGNVFLIDNLPVIDEIYWSKDGKKIDTKGVDRKYSKVSVDVPSLTIYNVNQYDAGHYTLTATNAAGTTVSDAIVLGAPDIVLDESKEEPDGSQIFTVTIKSIPAAYNVQWQVSENNSDMFTILDENAEEYRGTSYSIPYSVLVVRQKEILKNNIYQIEVQNFIGGRRKKIPSILNMFYKDKGAGAMFAKLFNELAESFPEKKLNRLHDLILDSCKDKDKELIPSLENAKSAREYFRILKKKELFTPLDVIFMQFLLRESNCGALNEKCITYAKTQKALCFYEEPPRNGYKKVKFHVEGNISNYTADQIKTIKETVAAIVGCDNEEIHLNGFCNSTSFFVVLSIKERYVNGIFNMKQQDKEKLVNLNINYIIVDSNHVYLKYSKAEENEENYEKPLRDVEMAASFEEGSFVYCPICLEEFRNPKYLPCLHKFCELCIQSFIESSILDCVQNHRRISVGCPVCQSVITLPAKNISDKEWAEQLPINHKILAISESFQKQTISEQEVFCDFCRQNGEQVIATIQCQHCRKNFCKASCKFIHKRVKAFRLHTFVDLKAKNTEIDTTVEPGNCLVHTHKPIEVDELDENDLENSSISCIKHTKQMRDLTLFSSLDSKKKTAEFNQENDEISINVAKKVDDIKQQINYLQSKLQNSLRSIYDEETSEPSFVPKTLQDFDGTLTQNENIASTVMQREVRKQLLIENEEITTKLKDLERSIHVSEWTKADQVKTVNELAKLIDDLVYLNERSDFITTIKIHYDVMEKEGSLKEMAEENKKCDEILDQKITSMDISEVYEAHTQPYTYLGGIAAPTNILFVAAMDFGTSFSGYAFARRVDLENDLSTISVPQWYASDGSLKTFKIPTTVLLDKDEQFVNFGFEAEFTYAELLENGKHEDYFYFCHFKMMLYNLAKTKRLTGDSKVSDILGRQLPVGKIFACAIKYLKDHMLEDLKRSQFSSLETDDIYWVLTVPEIWDEEAKMFMRKAAQEAGIPSDRLIIALEPEAASIYCKNLPAEKLKGGNAISVFQPGSKYLVLDAGGGNVDITVHKVQRNGHLKELDRASSGDWGGTSVDMAFKRALAEIVTVKMIESYSRKYPEDYLSLFRDFELNKRRCRKGQDYHSVCSLRIPISFMEECLETLGTDLTTLISNSKFKVQISLESDRMEINLKLFKTFFQPACNGIIKHAKELLQSPKLRDVNKIFMVGGFSESYILQDAIRYAFPNCQVIIPIDPSLAILRGAVMLGYDQQT